MAFSNKLTNLFEEKTASFKEVSEDQARSIVKKKAKNFMPQKVVCVFLNDEESEGADFTLVDPSSIEPKYSYHGLIMDSFNNWGENGDGFPKYEKGILAPLSPYTESSKRKYYGIIFDNTKIGITSGPTVIESFPNVSSKLNVPFEKFDKNFNIMLNVFNNNSNTVEDSTQKISIKKLKQFTNSKDEFKQALAVMDEFMTQKKERVGYLLEHPENKKNYPNVIAMLNYFRGQIQDDGQKSLNVIGRLFDPSENGFEISSFEKFDWIGNKDNKNKKIWFDKPCLLVRENMLNSFLSSLSDSNEKEN